jgi:antitoxin VapB
MPATVKTKVFISGRSQAVRVRPSTASPGDEVYSRRNPQTGNLIRSHSSDTWEDIFKALDEAEFFDDFLEDREQTPPKEPELL